MVHLSDQTGAIDQIDVDKVLLSPRQEMPFVVIDDLHSSVLGTFGLLRNAPVEYLSRKSRSDLLRRARAADVVLSTGSNGLGDVHCVTMLREFLCRTYEFMGAAEQVSACDAESDDVDADSM